MPQNRELACQLSLVETKVLPEENRYLAHKSVTTPATESNGFK